MAFTRSFLKALGIDEEKIEAIMSEHVTVTDGLKSERDKYKTEADKAADLQKQLDEFSSGEDYKAKYEKEHEDFEDFKKSTAEAAEAAKVQAAYRSLLVDEKIGAKRIETVMKVAEGLGLLKNLKLNKDGKFANEDELRKNIGDEWGDFRTTIVEKGANVETPPSTGSAKMTKEEIMKIPDTVARQKAIAENLNLFGKG